MATAQLDYQPVAIVDTSELSREEWLEYRRAGLGGSDASAALGVSPFVTMRDLYYDKCNIVSAIDDEDNWVALEVGNLLEELVSRIFHVKTGYRVIPIKTMFRHPHYPFMLADLDFLVEMLDGTTAILEIKTTNAGAIGKWWDDGNEIIPLNYELQGRHYMCVTNINRVYFCCLYGNTEDEVIIRTLDRDPLYEDELVYLEKHFWENHVLTRIPPAYIENGDLILKSVYKHFGEADSNAPEVLLDEGNVSNIARFLELQQQKSELEQPVKEIEKQMKQLKGLIAAEMGTSHTAFCNVGDESYQVAYKPTLKAGIDKKNLLRLKMQYPDLYDEFATVSESRRFSVKPHIVRQEDVAA